MITVYSTPHCSACDKLKKHLLEKKINYKEVDTSINNFAAKYLIEKIGTRTFPVLEIEDKILIGFNKKSVDCALNNYFMRNKNGMAI